MSHASVTNSFLSILLLSTGIAVFVESFDTCSNFCVCDTWYGLRRASCTGRHLYSIHTGVPHNVKALDLSNNSISSLESFELANTGLKEVKYLNLSGNSISQIDLNAFGGLDDLTVVDLTSNHLYFILSNVFAENRNLRILKLSKNNFNSHVPKLQSWHLMTLSMASCRIGHIPLDTFKGLHRLMNLDLSNNLLIQLDVAVFKSLRFLKMVSLEGNPWSCNALMTEVEVYLRHQNVEFTTVCGKASTPKQFEKMILMPNKLDKHHHLSTSKSTKNIMLIPRKYPPDVSMRKNVSIVTINENRKYYNSKMDDMSPYLFLIAGFVLGSAITLIASYFWLRKSTCCNEIYGTRERTLIDPQRLSLLSSFWHFEDISPNENGNSTLSREGTPPPPYREVMLCPGLYPSPVV